MTTMAEIRRITWSIFWKWTLIALIGGFVSGFVVGLVIGALVAIIAGPGAMAIGPWQNVISVISGLAGLFIGFLTLNYLLANSIGKQIGSKKLVLVDAFAAGEK
jgi:hypothetical protein